MPVRLTVVCPCFGDQEPYRLCDPEGYTAPNLMPANWVTHSPVADIAEALVKDGYPPGVHFGLLSEKNEILFIGEIGMNKR